MHCILPYAPEEKRLLPFSSWAVTLPIALILCKLTDLHIFAVYAIVQSADIIKVFIGYILIKKGIWISNLVESVNE